MDADIPGSDGNSSEDGEAMEIPVKNLVRLSADGGSTQSLKAAGAGEDNSKDGTQPGDQSGDLDKDIDSMVESSATYCQVGANASVSIGSIPADSTLETSDHPEIEERVLDGAPSEVSEVKYSDMDMNGNQVQDYQERQLPEMGEDVGRFLESVSSERSYTSEYSDSSAVAEAVVRSALDRAVNTVRMPEALVSANKTVSETSVSSSRTESTKEDSQANQAQYIGDLQETVSRVNDDDAAPSDDNDVVRDPDVELKPVDAGDVKVGLFQYVEADLDESDDTIRSPEVSEMEENGDDVMDSMTEAEKDTILKMYGLEGVDPMSPVSPKSASPSDSGNFKIDIAELKVDEEAGEDKVYRDIQREVYEPQTRNFSVNRDTSSAESTPRYDSARLDEQQGDVQKDPGAELDQVFPEAEMAKPPEEDAEGVGSPVAEIHDVSPPNVSSTVSPPLVQYESIKENGKFRIVKMPKESGQAAYSGVIVAGDIRSPKQSPRDSESLGSPRSHLSSLDNRQPEVEYDRQGAVGQNAWVRLESGDTLKSDRDRNQDNQRNLSSESKREQPVETGKSQNELDFEIPSRDAAKDLATRREPSTGQRQSPPQRDSPGPSPIAYADKNMGMPPSSLHLNGASKTRLETSTRMSPSELDTIQASRTRGQTEGDAQRIKYTTMQDTSGRETKRTGPKPFEVAPSISDPLLSDSRFLDEDGRERRQEVPYDKDRYTGSRQDDRLTQSAREGTSSSSSRRFPAAYEEDLIRSAYGRVAQRNVEPAVLSASLPARTSQDTGVIPGYRTLQEQQASWSAMFRTLEDQHRRDLHTQYEHHQYNIQRLQQQMELELQKQHVAIRRKIDLHKDALEQSQYEMEAQARRRPPDRSVSPQQRSPDRSSLDRRSLSADRSSRSQDLMRSTDIRSPDRSADRSSFSNRSPDRSQERMSRSTERSRDRSHDRSGSYSREIETLQNEMDTRTWREIYNEVRAEEDQLDSNHGNVRSPRSQPISRSPRSQPASKEERSRSFEKKKLEVTELELSVSRDVPKLDLRSRSPEGQASRSPERFTRSSMRSEHSPIGSDRLNQSTGSIRGRAGTVSPHVQALLHNLDDSRTSLRSLEGDATPTRQSAAPARLHDDHSAERPRAGVYSSPMPMFRGKGSKSDKSSPRERRVSPERPVYDSANEMSTIRSPRAADQSKRGAVSHDYAEFHTDSRVSGSMRDTTMTSVDSMNSSLRDTRRNDESYLSYSSRMNLREKHSKHLADLRAYYEDELRELRQALSESLDTTAISTDTVQSAVQNQLLEAENRHLLDKCRTMEDEIEELHSRMRATEQKNHGVEKRASEYSAALADLQAMGIQHKAHIEELQRYCRERDDLVNDLESKVTSNEDSVKIYKKNLEEEMELHRQDKIALQRIVDKYESLEREYKLLQETMNTTENKLYETRTEIVQLNRTMSKMELENKRLGRENDNLRHKVTQSLNLSALHESFGSPSSPRNNEVAQQPIRTKPVSSSANQMQESVSTDQRMPAFAVSISDWSTDIQKSKLKGSPVSMKTRSKVSDSPSFRHTEQTTRARTVGEAATTPQKSKKVVRDTPKKRQMDKLPPDSSENASSREDVPKRPGKSQASRSDVPTRDITPPRPVSPASGAESDVSDYSPLIKAERELYKLRDMMRQAVAIKPSSSDSPPQPKLQKKFYGSERAVSKDDYSPDLGPARGRKEKPGTAGSHKSVVKTKPGSAHSLSDKTTGTDKPRDRKPQSNKSDRGSTKSKDGAAIKDKSQRKDKELDKERMRNGDAVNRSGFGVHTEEFNRSTRFDIDIDEEKKTVSLTPRKEKTQSVRQRGEDSGTQTVNGDQQVTSANGTSQALGTEAVDATLDMMRGGQYTTRPQWENLYTSMAQARQPDTIKQLTKEMTIKDRIRTISEMEGRYDGLQAEKRQLESSINKIPLHGRVDRQNRIQKDQMEDRLDQVEKELGSLRMSLKRYNVLKTAG